MDGFGQMTETRSASITINPPRKAVVSIGWAYDDVAPGCVFDSGLGINRMNYSATARTFVWASGEDAGTVVKGDFPANSVIIQKRTTEVRQQHNGINQSIT